MIHRAAILGCGRIGSTFADDPEAARAGINTHAGAYAACSRTRLVAVADADRAQAERCARRWDVAAFDDDPVRLLAEHRPEVVSVCTPDSTHYDLVRAAVLTDGVRAVLAEKPLATTTAEAEALVELAAARGVVLAVNYVRRYAASHNRVRDLIRSGELGEVRLVRGLYTKGTRHNGSHWIDLARFLVGEVTGVEASDRLGETGDDPTLDLVLRFQSGATAVLHAVGAEDYTVFEMDLVTSRGRVLLVESGDVVELFRAVDGLPYAGYRALVRDERTEGGLRDVIRYVVEDLVECLDSGGSPRCTGRDGLRALQVADEACRSARPSGSRRGGIENDG